MNCMKVTEEPNNELKKMPTEKSDKEEISTSQSRKWHKWQRIFFSVIIIVFVTVIGCVCGFSIMRYRGGKNLKAETHHITYQGKEYGYRSNVINILCLGIDKEIPLDWIQEGRDNIGMADTIFLVSLDTDNDEVKVIAIPRDTMAEVQKTMENGEAAQKEELQICYQYAYGRTVEQGNKLMKECVSHLLYDIPIQRYCTLNFTALPTLNDAIGGVDVEVREDLQKKEPKLVYGETVHLEGELALKFVRLRDKERVDGTVLRTQRQKQYALAFVEKAKSVIAKNPTIPITLFQELQKDGNMSTDITLDDIAFLMPEVLNVSFPDDAIQVIPGESVMGETGFSEYHRDVEAIKELVINTFYEEV